MDLDPQQRPGRVLSVNTGVPRVLIDHQGRQWTTAILKSPVAGRVAVHGVNLEGDDQADRRVHGGPHKAVYAYAAADVAWWAAGMERELLPGAFGENLTVEGVDVSGAVVGERWRVGTALLEISQPRIPCPKLGVAMGDPHFPRDFADAERPGATCGSSKQARSAPATTSNGSPYPHTGSAWPRSSGPTEGGATAGWHSGWWRSPSCRRGGATGRGSTCQADG